MWHLFCLGVTDCPATEFRAEMTSNSAVAFSLSFRTSMCSIGRTAEVLGPSYNTVFSGVKKLMELGILLETINATGNRVFAHEEYLENLRPGP